MMKAYANTKNYGDYGKAIDKLDTLLHNRSLPELFQGNVIMNWAICVELQFLSRSI